MIKFIRCAAVVGPRIIFHFRLSENSTCSRQKVFHLSSGSGGWFRRGIGRREECYQKMSPSFEWKDSIWMQNFSPDFIWIRTNLVSIIYEFPFETLLHYRSQSTRDNTENHKTWRSRGKSKEIKIILCKGKVITSRKKSLETKVVVKFSFMSFKN